MTGKLEKNLFNSFIERDIEREISHFRTNYRGLSKRFPGEWVAIFGEGVLLHHKSYLRILGVLEEINVDSAYVQYLDLELDYQRAELSMVVGF